MSKEEKDYADAMQAALGAGFMLSLHDYDALLDACEHADAMAPLLDPTLWIKKRQAMYADMEVLKAAAPLANLIRKRMAAAAEKT